MASATGFKTSNGQIIGPDGQPFIARGVDVMEGQQPSAAELQAALPGVNFVRLAIYDFASPDALTSYVNDLTSHGIVVELEDHSSSDGQNRGGGTGTIFTGQQLTNELNWYSSVATAFKGNANVWFGTNNEPSEINPATGQNDPAALSNWQLQTYNAIRDTGNTAPVMLETTAWSPTQVNVGYNASDYAGMTNTIWDQHYYGWLSNYSTSQSTVSTDLKSIVAADHQIASANGTMPVIIGEYGDSTDGQNPDPNGAQVVKAVDNSGYGTVAWVYQNGPAGTDSLFNSGGGLSSYGQQVANHIAAGATSAPTTVITPPPTVTPGPSADDTVVAAGSGGQIVTTSGDVWTLANGVVEKNGAAAGYSAGVAEIATVGGTIWQENGAHLWWSWTGNGWSTGNGTATSPLPTAPAPTPTPVPTPSPAPTPVPTPTSANDTVVAAGSGQAITDASGNTWTIVNGVAQENGQAAGYSAGVTQIAYVNGTVWQENGSHLWWSWGGSAWAGGNGTSTSPLPPPTPTPPPVTPDTVAVMGTTGLQTVTAPGTVNGATFSLLANGVTKAVLGASPTFAMVTGTAGIQVMGGAGVAVIAATAGTNSFTAGTGAMDVTGGSGADSYTFGTGAHFLMVSDFSASKGDTLTVATSLKSGMQSMNDGAGGTLLAFGNGSAIDLAHVTTVPAIHWG